MSTSLKSRYSPQYISRLASALHKAEATFNEKLFIQSVFTPAFKEKELKQRMRHISHCLHKALSPSYEDNIAVLKEAYLSMKHSYYLENMIFQDYVEVYGLDNFELSISALACFTQGSSAEFAVRAFILKYENATMQVMKRWALSENEELRRLASEGCRPRLPWAMALPAFKKEPKKVLEILEILKDDNSKYVQKSVANNLNDISKDNPEIFKSILHQYRGGPVQRVWILKHASRTLLKQGDREVLEYFGFTKAAHVVLSDFECNEVVHLEEELFFSFKLYSKQGLGRLRVEFMLDFVRLNGRSSSKVFKLSEGDYDVKSKAFKKRFPFKKISTRKYYAGEHRLSILVNGEVKGSQSFIVKA